jgi:pimeloyl-ACP methyl ester carboxylesterase
MSSSRSTKAAYFRNRFAGHGIDLRCPDFNEPDFRSLTMTRMLAQLDRELASLDPGPVALIGSSLGGTLAILAAERTAPRVDRIVLLAPAVMFAKPGHHLLPPERLDQWRHSGSLSFFHYGDREERALDYAFYEDSLKYDAFNAKVPQPAIIFQGFRDESVDYRTVEQFARDRPAITLSLLDDDHQLMASLGHIAAQIEVFLELVE